MSNIRLDILQQSYWEHFKYAKDLALILPIDNHKRKKVENELRNMLDEINRMKDATHKEDESKS